MLKTLYNYVMGLKQNVEYEVKSLRFEVQSLN